MLAGFHGLDIPRGVKAVCEGVVDDLDLGVIDHGSIILEYSSDTVRGGVGLSFFMVSRRDRHERISGDGGWSEESVRGNARGAKKSDA
jgi:hypothetical protein